MQSLSFIQKNITNKSTIKKINPKNNSLNNAITFLGHLNAHSSIKSHRELQEEIEKEKSILNDLRGTYVLKQITQSFQQKRNELLEEYCFATKKRQTEIYKEILRFDSLRDETIRTLKSDELSVLGELQIKRNNLTVDYYENESKPEAKKTLEQIRNLDYLETMSCIELNNAINYQIAKIERLEEELKSAETRNSASL